MRRAPLLALYAADAISLTGNAVAQLAIPWYVLTTTGSPALTGVVVFFNFLPIVIAAFFGGVVVDRLGLRTTSVVADLASAGAVAAIPLLHSTVGIELWQLAALVFLGSLLDAPGATARQALFPDVVELAGMGMERATGIRGAIQQGSLLLGAPIGGVLVATFGATTALSTPRPSSSRRRSSRSSCHAPSGMPAKSRDTSSPSSPRACGSSGASGSSARSC